MKDFDPIDQYIQKRIDQTEVNYSGQFWAEFQEKLPLATHPSFMSRLKEWLIKSKILHVVSTVLFLASIFYFAQNRVGPDIKVSEIDTHKEQLQENKINSTIEDNDLPASQDHDPEEHKPNPEKSQYHLKNVEKGTSIFIPDMPNDPSQMNVDITKDSILITKPTIANDSIKQDQNPKKKKHLIW